MAEVANKIGELQLSSILSVRTASDFSRTALDRGVEIPLILKDDVEGMSDVDKGKIKLVDNPEKRQVITMADLLNMLHIDTEKVIVPQGEVTVEGVKKARRMMVPAQGATTVKQFLVKLAATEDGKKTMPTHFKVKDAAYTIGATQGYLTNDKSGARNMQIYPQLAEKHEFDHKAELIPLFTCPVSANTAKVESWREVTRPVVELIWK
jgi:hypothetical protein